MEQQLCPEVSVTASDTNGTGKPTQATDLPGVATIQVTAEDKVTIRTYTINFTVVTLESIAITTPASKLSYYVGETLNIRVSSSTEEPIATVCITAAGSCRKYKWL